jgi:long-chain acyl-CoA synthetase
MLAPEEVRCVAADCRARVILTANDKGEALLALRKDTPLEHVILYGAERPGARSLHDLISLGRDGFTPHPGDPHATSTIGYTSGTTGHPEGAMTTHRAVLLNSALTANIWVSTAADTAVTPLPCAHVYDNVIMNSTVLTGGTLVLMPRFEAEASHNPGWRVARNPFRRATAMSEGERI